MNKDPITLLADEALNISKEIEEIEEGRLSELKNLLDSYKEKLKKEMSVQGIKYVEGTDGYIKWVDSKSGGKLNEVEIAKKLKLENLNQFRIPGKAYSYLKIAQNQIEGEESFNK